jgi:hypothetical protein
MCRWMCANPGRPPWLDGPAKAALAKPLRAAPHAERIAALFPHVQLDAIQADINDGRFLRRRGKLPRLVAHWPDELRGVWSIAQTYLYRVFADSEPPWGTTCDPRPLPDHFSAQRHIRCPAAQRMLKRTGYPRGQNPRPRTDHDHSKHRLRKRQRCRQARHRRRRHRGRADPETDCQPAASVSAKHLLKLPHQRRPLFELGRVMRPHRSA